jgi:uncharacterized RDD family membrane protein YckC
MPHAHLAAAGAFPLRAAGFWLRLLAFGLDAAILIPVSVVLALATGLVDPATLPPRQGNLIDYLADVWNTAPEVVQNPVLLFAGLLFVYDALMTTMWGTSPGRRALGIRLFDSAGRAPRVGRAMARAALRMASFLLLGIGCLWSAAHRERRTLHDVIAGTYAGCVEG